MPVVQKSKHCRNCGKRTLFQKEQFSGGMGCLLTILTGGLFIPFWLLTDVLGVLRPYRCQQCGGK